jgi:2'-5' RNA ligase
MSELQFASSPFILTLKLDQATFKQVNALRQQYFPPERNFIPAHVTLFHTLPGDREIAISQFLQTLCSQTSNIPLSLPSLRFLGKGVAIEIEAPELNELRQTLTKTWNDWLTPQDLQSYRPHITIQNKVVASEARQVYEQLKDTWQPLNGQGEGLLLWYYRGGPWELANEFSFTNQEPK